MGIVDESTDFGTDVTLVTDLAPVWGLSSDEANLANAILRRLTTPRGSLFYDLDYGFDVTAFLNGALGPTDISNLKGAIASEIRKDPRVLAASADVVFTAASKTLQIKLAIRTEFGPFVLVIAAADATLELLSLAAA